MINNLAGLSEYETILIDLRDKLQNYLQETKDPRAYGESPWDQYNYDKPVGQLLEKK